jgi:hypothetical protein
MFSSKICAQNNSINKFIIESNLQNMSTLMDRTNICLIKVSKLNFSEEKLKASPFD